MRSVLHIYSFNFLTNDCSRDTIAPDSFPVVPHYLREKRERRGADYHYKIDSAKVKQYSQILYVYGMIHLEKRKQWLHFILKTPQFRKVCKLTEWVLLPPCKALYLTLQPCDS